jgi:release factor glutamine methyltransferase
VNIQEAITYATQLFLISPVSRPEHVSKKNLLLDAEVLLSFCLEKPRSFLFTWPEQELTEIQISQFKNIINKRAENFPLAYLVGQQEFWSLPFKVNQDVLIPRPETECLVEFILEHFPNTKEKLFALDLGTGSGALALALASERQNWFITACDQSSGALNIAKENAQNLNINNVEFIKSDWFQNIPNLEFDLIVSNPPYVCNNAVELVNESIQFEPASALCAGADGLDDIKIICAEASRFLKPDALIVIEHGSSQAQAVKEIFEQNNFNQVKCFNDYSGLNRFTVAFNHH